MSEQDVIKRCKNHDFEAFGELVLMYEKPILNYCYRTLGNISDAEDATQEVFLKVFRFIESFSEKSSFKTWLYKIASNICLDFLRKQKRTGTPLSLHQTNQEGEEYLLTIEDTSYSPYEQALENIAQKALLEAISKLDEDKKRMILLRDIEGFSYDEIANITGKSVGTVKSGMSRARLKLKELLEKDKELFIK